MVKDECCVAILKHWSKTVLTWSPNFPWSASSSGPGLKLSLRWKWIRIIDSCTNFTPSKAYDNNLLVCLSGNYQGCTFPYKGHYRQRSEQTFNRALNRCPSLRWKHSDWKLLAHLCSSNGNMTLSCWVLFSVTTTTLIPCPVGRDDIVPLK